MHQHLFKTRRNGFKLTKLKSLYLLLHIIVDKLFEIQKRFKHIRTMSPKEIIYNQILLEYTVSIIDSIISNFLNIKEQCYGGTKCH